MPANCFCAATRYGGHSLCGDRVFPGRVFSLTLNRIRALGQTITDAIRLIDTARLPDGGKLLLLQSGDQFSIELDNEELMGNTDHVSEEALATMTAERLPMGDPHVLIGGLGMGFTLGAAIGAWGPGATIDVAELIPEVVQWAKGPLAHVFGTKLSDPRVTVRVADVHDVIRGSTDHYDAIMLDVDNGPDGLVQMANDRLYGGEGLESAYLALRPGGILAVWSADPDIGFYRRLCAAGFVVDEVAVPAFAGSVHDDHVIWFATRP